jgi:hypothetical protein
VLGSVKLGLGAGVSGFDIGAMSKLVTGVLVVSGAAITTSVVVTRRAAASKARVATGTDTVIVVSIVVAVTSAVTSTVGSSVFVTPFFSCTGVGVAGIAGIAVVPTTEIFKEIQVMLVESQHKLTTNNKRYFEVSHTDRYEERG